MRRSFSGRVDHRVAAKHSKTFQASVTFDDAYHENVPILSSGTNNSDTLVAFYPRNTGPPGYGHRGHLPGGVQRRTRSRAALVQLLGEPQNLGLDVGDPVRLLQDDGAELPWACTDRTVKSHSMRTFEQSIGVPRRDNPGGSVPLGIDAAMT